MAGVFTPDIISHATQRGWRETVPTFPQSRHLSLKGDVGLDWGLLILDHPAGKLSPIQRSLYLPGVLQRVGPIWVSGDLGGLHGLHLVPILHPGEVQVGRIEVAHMTREIHSLMHTDLHRRGLGGDLQGGDN